MPATWGRVLVCGRVAADEASHGAAEAGTSLTTPHILRSVCHIRMTRVITSSVADHAVFLSVHGDAYVYGRNTEGQCGVASMPGAVDGGLWLYNATRLDRQRDFVPSLPDTVKIVGGATGATHTLLLTSQGTVYAAGSNAQGQCGLGVMPASQPFRQVDMPFSTGADPVKDMGCTRTGSVLVTTAGHVYVMGSAKHGFWGTGPLSWQSKSASEVRYATQTTPMRVPSLDAISSIACGEDHVVALSATHQVYVWGRGALSRLGCGTQWDQPQPVRIPQFARVPASEQVYAVYAGRTVTACVDNASRLWIAGTFRTQGDGSAGQSFIIYKPLPELAEYDVEQVALGADTIQCTARPTYDGAAEAGAPLQVLGWGEGALHAELGYPATTPALPDVIPVLTSLRPVRIASGRHTSYWIVEPDPSYADLPRFPDYVASSSVCLVCQRGGDEDDATLLECGRCENPYHLACLTPPLEAVPPGEWLCESCRAHDTGGEAADDAPAKTTQAKSGAGAQRGRKRRRA